MPRLVFFLLLLLPLLACAQAVLAARLPEVQAAGSLKAETPAQGMKVIPARKDSAGAPPTSLAAADPNAGAGQPPQHQTNADKAPPASADVAPAPGAVEKADEKTAAAIISGSRRPGIIEHQIVRTNREDKPDINLSYPSLGIRAVDANIREWATGIANAFEETFNSPGLYPDENRPVPELWCSYSLSHPSDKALSITFEVWTYTGGAQGNLDIMTLNYSLLTGQRLGLVDIFEDPDAALAIMSAWSRRERRRRLPPSCGGRTACFSAACPRRRASPWGWRAPGCAHAP